MDPRHPEQAISRMRELMKQYDRVEKEMKKATTSAQLGQLEREGGLVVQEICLVAPRIHEAMMQTSRQRRHDLAHGAAFRYKPEERVGKYTKATIALEEKPVEKNVNKNEEKVGIEEPDVNEKPEPKTGMMDEATADKILDAVEKVAPAPKKKATKKKTAKKAKK